LKSSHSRPFYSLIAKFEHDAHATFLRGLCTLLCIWIVAGWRSGTFASKESLDILKMWSRSHHKPYVIIATPKIKLGKKNKSMSFM